jgi:hypothetical protein
MTARSTQHNDAERMIDELAELLASRAYSDIPKQKRCCDEYPDRVDQHIGDGTTAIRHKRLVPLVRRGKHNTKSNADRDVLRSPTTGEPVRPLALRWATRPAKATSQLRPSRQHVSSIPLPWAMPNSDDYRFYGGPYLPNIFAMMKMTIARLRRNA